ncbi:MAG: glycosyltransferase, partial [candidate division KSB1 bacterium]|nr:glycosyltransferase [candidate division KSB1 bacterium]
ADTFLAAVQELVSGGVIPAERIALRFTGRTDSLHWLALEEQGILHLSGYVDHKTAISHMLESDVLLLILTHERGADTIPGKTFEYLGSRRPILALVPPQGAAAAIIREAKAGLVVDPQDVEQIKEAIVYLFNRWQEGQLAAETDPEYIQQYTRRQLAGKLAGFLDSLCHTRESPLWMATVRLKIGGD